MQSFPLAPALPLAQDLPLIVRRAAFGVLAPFDMELDAELWRWLPTGVDMLISRTPYVSGPVTVEFAHLVSDDAALTTGVQSLIAGRASVVAYACTSGSFIAGKAGERRVRRAMKLAGAAHAVTASGAIIDALTVLGVGSVSVATPYVPSVAACFTEFLGERGILVTRSASIGLDREIWNVPYAQTAELIRAVDRADSEAIVVSCTNLPTFDLIAPLEAELGKPIITANQALMWAALRKLAIELHGPGQALAERTPVR